MPPGRSSRTHARSVCTRIEQVLEHVEERHRVEAAGLEAAVLERGRAQVEAARRGRTRPPTDSGRCRSRPSRRRAPPPRRSRCCSRRRGTAARVTVELPRHQRHALAAEPLHAVVVALDAEVAHDVLVLLRRVHLLVVRLVERRAHVHEVAGARSAPAACGPCPARGAASALPQVGHARGRSRSSGIRPCARTSSSIGCVRFSISCLYEPPGRSFGDVHRLILGRAAIGNLHAMGRRRGRRVSRNSA